MQALSNVSKFWGEKLTDQVWIQPGEEVFLENMIQIARESSRILEIGVGTGRMPKLLRKNGVTGEIFGIDISENVCRSETVGIVGDARALPLVEETFDFVYSLGVVEHFFETTLAIKEHARVAKTGGYVLITTPHLSLFTPFRLAAHWVMHREYGPFSAIKGRNLSLHLVTQYVKSAGLQIVASGFWGLFGIKWFLRRLGIQEQFLHKFQHIPMVGAFLFVLAKKLNCPLTAKLP